MRLSRLARWQGFTFGAAFSPQHAEAACAVAATFNFKPAFGIMLLNSQPLSEDLGYLTLRIGFGGTMLWQHGWPKLMHFTERMDSFADPFGISSPVSLVLMLIAEVLCSALVVLGLWTRIACIPLIIAMGVIIFMIDRGRPLGESELALVYLVAFIVLLLTGSGRFAIDRLSFK
jgi:putative oxidoreductase